MRSDLLVVACRCCPEAPARAKFPGVVGERLLPLVERASTRPPTCVSEPETPVLVEPTRHTDRVLVRRPSLGTYASSRGLRRRQAEPRPALCEGQRGPTARSAASSVSGRHARTSPSSPTTASTRCSTAARRQPGWPSATAVRLSWSTRSSAWSVTGLRRVDAALSSARPDLAIGHTRYSTTGSCTWENAQPTLPQHTASHRRHRARPQRQPDQHPRARQADGAPI